MVSQTRKDGETWCECDIYGMLFDDQANVSQHEATCGGEDDPSYIQ